MVSDRAESQEKLKFVDLNTAGVYRGKNKYSIKFLSFRNYTYIYSILILKQKTI